MDRAGGKRVRRLGLHALRVALFVTIIASIHFKHVRTVAQRRAQFAGPVPLERVLTLFPIAAKTSRSEGADEEIVLDGDGRTVGSVLRTSPSGDDVVGFSGPTDVLLGLDSNDRVAGLEILSSEDTREHVKVVREHPTFLRSLDGVSRDQANRFAEVDVVSGATLTSRAIQETVIRRLGGEARSLRFAEDLSVEESRVLFPSAAKLVPHGVSAWVVRDKVGSKIGTVFRTAPFADGVLGYQGPTDSMIGFDAADRVTGIALKKSFDNEPYVGYVREDLAFRQLFDGRDLKELAAFDVEAEEFEGVSGATMTSLAVVDGIVRAARAHAAAQATRAQPLISLSVHDVGASLSVAFGMLVGFTRLRRHRVAKYALQMVLVVYLGLNAGMLVSQASLAGWAKAGVPWKSASGFVLLTAAALIVPVASGRNIYCTHLCPHGALQG
ncbi:MAG: FMN-binding protein, partial [Planctomycetota bacterium]